MYTEDAMLRMNPELADHYERRGRQTIDWLVNNCGVKPFSVAKVGRMTPSAKAEKP
jgi:hypothetical protein